MESLINTALVIVLGGGLMTVAIVSGRRQPPNHIKRRGGITRATMKRRAKQKGRT